MLIGFAGLAYFMVKRVEAWDGDTATVVAPGAESARV